MAKIDFSGLDNLSEGLKRLSAAAEAETAAKMLEAGAAVMIDAQKQSIVRCGLVDTGDMLNSVKATKVTRDSSGAHVIDVFPQGKDRKGVRNAEKYFIAEYGKSTQPATRTFTLAMENGAEPALDAMHKVWEEAINVTD